MLLTDALFQGDGPKETPEEKRLRHAPAFYRISAGGASRLSRRASLNVIAHSGLAGIDHPGRMFLALSIFYRHAGGDDDRTDELSIRLRTAISKRMLKRARIVGGAVRTAHMLSIGMPRVIDENAAFDGGGKLVLTLPRFMLLSTVSGCSGACKALQRFSNGRARFAFCHSGTCREADPSLDAGCRTFTSPWHSKRLALKMCFEI